eukprot:jgi/Chrzof1/12698/Cz07g04130.t1
MFYHVQISQTIDLEPQHFGPNLKRVLKEKVIEKGKIRQDGSGLATFKVKFECVSFRPFKGEVLDCLVTSVNKMGFFAEAGPLQIFVSSHVSAPRWALG